MLGSQGYTRGSLPPGNPRAGGRSRAERDLRWGAATEVPAHTDLSLVSPSFLFKHLCSSWALLPSPAFGEHGDLLCKAWGPLALVWRDATWGVPKGLGELALKCWGWGLRVEEQGV